MEASVKKYSTVVAGNALAGVVSTPKPVWARRVHATPHGIMLGLDRAVMFTRRNDEVLIGVRDKHGIYDHIITLSERGFEPATKYHRNKEDCSVNIEVENEVYSLKLLGLKLQNGRLTGAVELRPSDAPHFYGSFDLQLVGWTAPKKYIHWRCH